MQHGILKQDAGPYRRGTTVSTDPAAAAPVVYVDPGRFKAWQDAGLLKAVKEVSGPDGGYPVAERKTVEVPEEAAADDTAESHAMKEEPHG